MSDNNHSSELKKIQQVQLDILLEFDRVAKKHNIPYQLFAGTLLGSIRHEGFIPWDDDIDIAILREDYDRFLAVANEEMSKDYFVQTYETDKDYYKQSCRIRKNGTLMLQELYEAFPIHHGISISLMPMDNIRPDTLLGKGHRVLYQIVHNNLWRLNNARALENCRKESNKAKRLMRYVLFGLSKVIPKYLTDRLHTKVATLYNNRETEYITHLTNGATEKRFHAYKMKRKAFYNTIKGKFEGHTFPIPRNYDDVLSNLYGDYMSLPPEEDREPHHGVVKVDFSYSGNQKVNREERGSGR